MVRLMECGLMGAESVAVMMAETLLEDSSVIGKVPLMACD